MDSQFLSQLNSDTLVLTANRRLATVIRQRYDQTQIEKEHVVWPSATVLPLNSWILKLWQTHSLGPEKILTEIQEQSLWSQIVPHENLIPTVQQAWQLIHDWQIPLSTLAHQAKTSETQLLVTWAQTFTKRCQNNQWESASALPKRLMDALPHCSLNWPKEIVIIGFDDIPPVYQQLLTQLKTHTRVTQVNGQAIHSDCLSTVYPNLDTEIKAMASWAKQQLNQHPQQTIACVVPALTQCRPLINHIFKQTFAGNYLAAYNISHGEPLTQFAVINTALQVLEWGFGTLTLTQAHQYLPSHYLCQSEADIHMAALLDVELRKNNTLQLPLSALLIAIHHWQDQYPSNTWLTRWRGFLHLCQSTPAQQAPSQWAHFFIQQCQILGWPGGRALNSLEYQLINRWEKLLVAFSELDEVTDQMDHQTAYHFLKTVAQQTIFQTQSEQQTPIQVLGILESSGLQFDALWVMGLDDQSWPPLAKPNPFLPYALQVDKQMPHACAERELSYATKITQRLLETAPQIRISASSKQADETPRISSLFKNHHAITPDNALNVFHVSQAEKEPYPPDQGPMITNTEKIRGGSAILTKQAECPFRAFAHFRLNAVQLAEPVLGVDALERGILTHTVLEKIWEELKDQKTLQNMDELVLVNKITHLVDGLFDRSIEPLFWNIERRRLIKLIHHWLIFEKKRPPFTVIAQESECQITLNKLTLSLKIDRIDQLLDGCQMIIDYKTGFSHSASWFGERLQQPQLPLYCVYSDKTAHFSAISFAQVKEGSFSFKGIHDEQHEVDGVFPAGVVPQQWPELLDSWKQALETLSENFYQGNASVDPAEEGKPCQTCDLQPLCRVHAHG